MGKVITVANEKGGVAKTTTVLNLGFALSRKGQKVLLVDLDPQSSLSYMISPNNSIVNPDVQTIKEPLVHAALDKELDSQYSIFTHPEGVDYIMSSKQLANIPRALQRARGFTVQDIYGIIAKYMDRVRDNYDWIIIDTNPSIESLLVRSAIAASDYIIIPTLAEIPSYVGVKSIVETIRKGVDSDPEYHLNHHAKIAGVVFTKVNMQLKVSQEIYARARATKGLPVFKTFIPAGKAANMITTDRKSIFTTFPDSKPALAYDALADEVMAVCSE